MVEPRKVHYVTSKHILHYMERTIDYGLDYRWGLGVRLVGYTNSDWARCASNLKRTSRCCFRLGLEVVLWFSRKKKSVALSSFEAEYMAAS